MNADIQQAAYITYIWSMLSCFLREADWSISLVCNKSRNAQIQETDHSMQIPFECASSALTIKPPALCSNLVKDVKGLICYQKKIRKEKTEKKDHRPIRPKKLPYCEANDDVSEKSKEDYGEKEYTEKL